MGDVAEEVLHRIQRKVGRVLLGHSFKSPLPSVLAELGWAFWQTTANIERIRLCGLLVESRSQFTNVVLGATSSNSSSWVGRVALLCAPWCPRGLPSGKGAWGGMASGRGGRYIYIYREIVIYISYLIYDISICSTRYRFGHQCGQDESTERNLAFIQNSLSFRIYLVFP